MYKLRAGVNTATKEVVYDIMDYTIEKNDVKLNTAIEGKVLKLDETDYLIVLGSEKANILVNGVNDDNWVRIDKKDYKNKISFSVAVLNESTQSKYEKKQG